jgi:hypothetical protein
VETGNVQIGQVKKVTRDGKGNIAKLYYHNVEGLEKSFQVGNSITRGIYYVAKLCGGNDNWYLRKALLALKVLGPYTQK